MSSQNEPEFDKNYRSVVDIVWTCLSTIFVCIWVSIHPNLRRLRSTWFQQVRSRSILMLWAFISPEVFVLTSVQQWFGARQIAKVFRKDIEEIELKGKQYGSEGEEDPEEAVKGTPKEPYKWSFVHSHFVQMGAYVRRTNGVKTFYDCDKLLQPTEQSKRLREMIIRRNDEEQELMDHSKGDGLAKGLVVVQLLWFAANCIGRKVQNLTISKLELMTIAYAIPAVFMYIFWWNKPLDVQCPIVVDVPEAEATPSVEAENSDSTGQSDFANGENGEEGPVVNDEEAGTAEVIVVPRSGPPAPSIRSNKSNKSSSISLMSNPDNSKMINFGNSIVAAGNAFTKRFNKSQSEKDRTQYEKLYSFGADGEDTQVLVTAVLCATLSSAYNAIYIVAWGAEFPSPTAHTLWRVSTLIATIYPTLFTLMLSAGLAPKLVAVLPDNLCLLVLVYFFTTITTMVTPILFLGFPAYVVARLSLTVLSFMDLAHLSQSAHKTVEWSDFLPHVGG